MKLHHVATSRLNGGAISERAAVELFHLVFLRALVGKG
jgi:hypothetical protein